MGIAVEPIEPCVDSDCYYAGGEYLTWWVDHPVPPPPQNELTPGLPPPPYTGEEPPRYSEPSTPSPTPPSSPSPAPSPPPSFSPAPPPLRPRPTPEPETRPQEDPLYAAIAGLLSQRPPVQARETPVVLVPQGTTSPILPLLLVILGVGGVVTYAYLRRKA